MADMTPAQKAQQSNRDEHGQYKDVEQSEADGGTNALTDLDNEDNNAVIRAVSHAQDVLNLKHYDFADDEPETALSDALSDLRHWADAHDVDMFAALDRSYNMYLQEKSDPHF